MPSVLETTFENPTDQGGLGLSSVQYNLLYSIYAWTNAVMVRNHAQQCAMHASSLVCFHSRTLQFMPCLFPVLFFILWSLFFFFLGGGVLKQVIGAGFLVDKAGNRLSLMLFSGLCLIGACLFALVSRKSGSF